MECHVAYGYGLKRVRWQQGWRCFLRRGGFVFFGRPKWKGGVCGSVVEWNEEGDMIIWEGYMDLWSVEHSCALVYGNDVIMVMSSSVCWHCLFVSCVSVLYHLLSHLHGHNTQFGHKFLFCMSKSSCKTLYKHNVNNKLQHKACKIKWNRLWIVIIVAYFWYRYTKKV